MTQEKEFFDSIFERDGRIRVSLLASELNVKPDVLKAHLLGLYGSPQLIFRAGRKGGVYLREVAQNAE